MKRSNSHIGLRILVIGGFLVINLFPALSSAQNKEITAASIFTNMFTAIQNVKTLRYNLYAFERVDETPLPERQLVDALVAVGVERVDRVMFGGHVNYVVHTETWNAHAWQIKRLSVRIPI